jgi:alkanesulfonate monooxygenase SsuD/methylene tetrahydromethanopterin reductase-like flavin-dependent oxidoreductase (luciferase family)
VFERRNDLPVGLGHTHCESERSCYLEDHFLFDCHVAYSPRHRRNVNAPVIESGFGKVVAVASSAARARKSGIGWPTSHLPVVGCVHLVAVATRLRCAPAVATLPSRAPILCARVHDRAALPPIAN